MIGPTIGDEWSIFPIVGKQHNLILPVEGVHEC